MERGKSIQLLNAGIADELQAVHQYMYFHFHLVDQGFGPLAALFKRIAIQEMGHVEVLAERILFLKGDAEMVAAGAIEKITDPETILSRAMAMEDEAIGIYNRSALLCAAESDAGSKQLFEKMVQDEESHFDQFEKQFDNIKRFGLSYLALQSFGGERGASEAPGAE